MSDLFPFLLILGLVLPHLLAIGWHQRFVSSLQCLIVIMYLVFTPIALHAFLIGFFAWERTKKTGNKDEVDFQLEIERVAWRRERPCLCPRRH